MFLNVETVLHSIAESYHSTYNNTPPVFYYNLALQVYNKINAN